MIDSPGTPYETKNASLRPSSLTKPTTAKPKGIGSTVVVYSKVAEIQVYHEVRDGVPWLYTLRTVGLENSVTEKILSQSYDKLLGALTKGNEEALARTNDFMTQSELETIIRETWKEIRKGETPVHLFLSHVQIANGEVDKITRYKDIVFTDEAMKKSLAKGVYVKVQ